MFNNLGRTLRNQNPMKKLHENNRINCCILTQYIVILIGHGVAVPAAKVTQCLAANQFTAHKNNNGNSTQTTPEQPALFTEQLYFVLGV
jgi:hypothetical protein